MTEPVGQTSGGVPHGRLRLMVCLAGLALFALLIYTDLIARTYMERVLLTAICMAVTGAAYGYGPQSEERGWRAISVTSITFWPALMAINPLARFVNLHDMPADQRYAEMIKPHYFLPIVVFVLSALCCYAAGSVLYRRRHPEQAFIPVPEEDRRKPEDEAAARRTLVRYAIPAAAWYGAAILLMNLFPHQRTLIMVTAVLASFAALSLLVGIRWHELGSRKWFWIAMAVLGPAAGFAGYYGAARVHDYMHLVRAIWFAGWVAAAWLVPLVVCRIFLRLRRSNSSDSC